MLARARQTRDSYVAQALTWEDFMAKIGAGNLVLTPYCNEKAAGVGAPPRPRGWRDDGLPGCGIGV